MTSPDDRARIDLESRIAVLERTIESLSAELATQQKQVEGLTENVRLLVEQLQRLRSREPIEPHDSPPPHWGG